MTTRIRHSPGRPPATSHAAIEAAAFRLFAEHGFEETTVEDIAEAAGIGRRTLFRYFPSKYDIPWGQFEANLSYFRETLDSMPVDIPVSHAVQKSVVEFNRVDADAMDQHRERMKLILRTPALQAHSVLMYAQWRNVIADYVAARYEVSSEDALPQAVGHVSLALALSAYEQWLRTDDGPIADLLESSLTILRSYLADGVQHR